MEKNFSSMILKPIQLKEMVVVSRFAVCCPSVSKKSIYMLYRDVLGSENTKLERDVSICKREDCIDKMFIRINKK